MGVTVLETEIQRFCKSCGEDYPPFEICPICGKSECFICRDMCADPEWYGDEDPLPEDDGGWLW